MLGWLYLAKIPESSYFYLTPKANGGNYTSSGVINPSSFFFAIYLVIGVFSI